MQYPRKTKWWISSSSDPRWNAEGLGYQNNYEVPFECKDKLTQLEKEYGEQPLDLKFGYSKT